MPSVTKYATETDKRITTVFDTVYLTQTQKAVTTTYISTSTVTSGTGVLPTVTVTHTVSACSGGTSTSTGGASTTTGGATTTTGDATATTEGTSTSTSATTTNTAFTTTELAQQVNPTAISTHGLADYAAAVGRYFGTAVDYPGTGEGSDPVYMAVATDNHEFDQWTPANIMKVSRWLVLVIPLRRLIVAQYEFTEPSQGVFDFSGGDSFIALAHQNGINTIRCHNLIWHSEIPNWLQNGNWTRDTLLPVMYNHIEQLMTHWGNNCTHWYEPYLAVVTKCNLWLTCYRDVVNEALSDSPTATDPWRHDVWYNAIGPDYVQLAFAKAAEVAANHSLAVKLFYNDYRCVAPPLRHRCSTCCS